MKRLIRSSNVEAMSKIQSKGPFWYIPDTNEILSFPYDESNYDTYRYALSRNGLTFTHKRLWPEISGTYKKYPYNYFPRGRVEVDNKGRSVIYMNPNIPNSAINEIKIEFGILNEPIIKYDNSSHYKCYLDDGWKADR